MDGDRKCFRMIGGVLVERTVKEVTPALTSNSEKLGKLIETLEKQLKEKGEEINGYMEKHNIQVRGGQQQQQQKKAESENVEKAEKKTTGILV